jgi:hypothetical protein
MQTALIVVLSLLNAGVVGLGIYLGSYLKKKAQNLATREEFKDLQKQTAELTRTTKEIEATISGELWNQQKRWELKREVFFQVVQRISAVFDALKGLDNVLQTELKNPSVVTETWKQMSVSENEKWFKAMAAFHEAQLFVGVTFGKDVVEVLDKYAFLTTGVAGLIHKKDGQIFKSSAAQLFDLHEAMRAAFRKELGITH